MKNIKKTLVPMGMFTLNKIQQEKKTIYIRIHLITANYESKYKQKQK